MENPRPEKVAVVDEVRSRLDAADAVILTEYRGLKVKDLAGLRRELRKNGADYKVYKNTLVRFATRSLGLDELDGMLEGPTAIAFVEGDAAAVAKTLRDYSRTNQLLVVKGGVLGGKVLDAAGTAALADLPSREVLLSRIAGGLAAPLQQFAGLLQALPRNLAYGLAALRDQRADGEEAEPAAVVEVEAAAEAAPAEPEAAPAEAALAEPEPDVAAVEAEAEPVVAEAEAVPAGPEPEAAVVEPEAEAAAGAAPAEPEVALEAEADAVPAEPEPEAAEVEPEPEAAVAEPEPEAAAAEPDPDPAPAGD
jgi:large subunit ribosomal protein L10